MFVLLLTIALTAFTISRLKWHIRKRHIIKMSKNFESPEGVWTLPILGNSMYFMGSTERVLLNISRFCGYPKLTKCWFNSRLYFALKRPEDMEIVLNSEHTMGKDESIKFTTPLAGHGLFSISVPKWKVRRRLIAPAFNNNLINQFVPVFGEGAENITKSLEVHVNKEIDIQNLLSNEILTIVCETIMGVDIKNYGERNVFGTAIKKCLNIIALRIFNILYHFDFIYKFSKHAATEKEQINVYHKIVTEIVSEKQKLYNEEQKRLKEQIEAEIDDKPKTRKAFLDTLLELTEKGVNFDEADMIDEVKTFIIGASDTSSTTMSFFLLMLAMHQDVQDKCLEEICDVIGHERLPEAKDLQNLKYMEKALNESMRLFPVAATTVRTVSEDTQLHNALVPKGTGLFLSILTMHRSELYYKDPLKYDPERFNPEEVAKRHPYSFLPFLKGPRNCIGYQYAYRIMKTIIVSLLRKYKFTTSYKRVEDIRIKQAFVTYPVEGFKISIQLR